MKTNLINYELNNKKFIGYLASPGEGKYPCVLIAHTWAGRDSFVEEKARLLAESGYAAFAIDMYGDGRIGASNEENASMMQPLLDDRKELARRVSSALEALKDHDNIDMNRVSIMGYCFGGLVALDLARTSAEIKGAVSFHGFLAGPENNNKNSINAKILAFHGELDPMVDQNQVDSFSKEMTLKQADWQLHTFGNAMHAFTNPDASDPDFGTVYSQTADRRSWKIYMDFLEEIFK